MSITPEFAALPPAPSDAPAHDGGMFSRPPGIPMHLAAILAMAGILDAFSAPGFFFLEALAFVLLWLILIAIWLIRLAIFITINRGRGQLRQSIQAGWRRWLAAPIIVVIMFAIVTLQLPLRLRFAVSRNELNRLAHRAIAGGPKPLAANWGIPAVRAKLFDVNIVQVTSDGEVDFRVPGTEFFRSYSGFTYRPAGNPSDPEGSFEPLGGPWYVWHTSW
jgi:hypothetical protein